MENRTVASIASERADYPASGQPGSGGSSPARWRKKPKALAASAADDFRVVELAATDLIAGRCVQDSFRCPRRVRPAEICSVASWTPAPIGRRRRGPCGLRRSALRCGTARLTAFPSGSGTSRNSSGNARASRDIVHATPERSSANRARVWSSMANKWDQLSTLKNAPGPGQLPVRCAGHASIAGRRGRSSLLRSRAST